MALGQVPGTQCLTLRLVENALLAILFREAVLKLLLRLLPAIISLLLILILAGLRGHITTRN